MTNGCNETGCFEYIIPNEEDDKSLADKILLYLQLYYTPLLVILGCVGNTLSVFVFFGTKLKKLSSSYYLAALAFSDTGFLVTEFVVWLNMVDVPLFKKSGVCELAIYSSHVSTSSSSSKRAKEGHAPRRESTEQMIMALCASKK
jgi:hypothetical protein